MFDGPGFAWNYFVYPLGSLFVRTFFLNHMWLVWTALGSVVLVVAVMAIGPLFVVRCVDTCVSRVLCVPCCGPEKDEDDEEEEDPDEEPPPKPRKPARSYHPHPQAVGWDEENQVPVALPYGVVAPHWTYQPRYRRSPSPPRRASTDHEPLLKPTRPRACGCCCSWPLLLAWLVAVALLVSVALYFGAAYASVSVVPDQLMRTTHMTLHLKDGAHDALTVVRRAAFGPNQP